MKKYLLGLATGYGIGSGVVLFGGLFYRWREEIEHPGPSEILSGIELAAVWPLTLFVLLTDEER